MLFINAALEMTREEGFEKLNARSLAEKMGISVQPLFRCFRNMEELKQEIVRNVLIYYEEYLRKNINKEDVNASAGHLTWNLWIFVL